MSYLKTLYRLDVRKHKQHPIKIDVKETISVGGDPRNDIILVGKNCLPKHLIFEPKGENLSLHNMGLANQTFLNSTPLEYNKNYLLEAGDHVQISELEIIIGLVEIETKPTLPVIDRANSKEHVTKSVVFHSLNDLVPESESDNSSDNGKILYVKNETGSMKFEKKVKTPIVEIVYSPTIISLLVIKLYALLLDFFLTYFLLTSISPLAGVHELSFSLYQVLSEIVMPYSSHSFWPFFFIFYFLRLVQILLFGTSIGQLLMGLGTIPKSTVLGIIGLRIKIVVCALFLYPAQNIASNHFFFSALRKVGVFLLFLFILISPLLLPQLTITKLNISESKGLSELNTVSYLTTSENYKLTLNLEIPPRFSVYPIAKKRAPETFGIKIYDLKEKKNLEITEHHTLLIDSIEEALRFANPFLSFHQKLPLRNQSRQDQKEIIQKILLTSIDDISSQIKTFGLFFANNVFVKNLIIRDIEKTDLNLRAFLNDAPFISLENQNILYTLLFSGEKLISLKLDKTSGNSALQTLATTQLLNKWTINEKTAANQGLDFLEILDAFKRQDEQTVLTYYINSAKKPLENKILYREEDFTEAFKVALKSNIDELLPVMILKNTKTSLEEIKKQLTPMENPGD
ncbi:MAG: FHA domain-containing protein [Bacteriovoracaceae bacterium]|nr:FHA domain-containing protein [Bacteriovoracaceae bacterium]